MASGMFFSMENERLDCYRGFSWQCHHSQKVFACVTALGLGLGAGLGYIATEGPRVLAYKVARSVNTGTKLLLQSMS